MSLQDLKQPNTFCPLYAGSRNLCDNNAGPTGQPGPTGPTGPIPLVPPGPTGPTGPSDANSITVSPVGKLLGPFIQDDINYLGEVYNNINGFSLTAIGDEAVTSTLIADSTAAATMFTAVSADDYSDGNYNTTTGTYIIPTSGRWLFGANILLSSNATTTGSLLAWGNIGSHNIPAFASLNNDGWGFSSLPHLNAGSVCMLNIGTIIGGFTTTLLTGSTIFGRLIQPDI
jgi:hypothetical protein